MLDPTSFKKEVLNSNELWMIEFFAPWCGHCQALKPVYEKTAKAFKGIVRFGAVDVDTHKEFGGQYGIKGFPTLKFFGENKNKPIDYQDGRDETSISKFVLKTIKSTVNERLGLKSSQKSGQGSKDSKDSKGASSDGDVIVLDDSNFDQTGKRC